jgi:MoxR-like ATPase
LDAVLIENEELVHLAREALASGDTQSTRTVRNLARRLRDVSPQAATELTGLLRAGVVRGAKASAVETPLDVDTRMPLVRIEDPARPDRTLVLSEEVGHAVDQLVMEHKNPGRLAAAGLAPSRTALLVGPPGVGKTTAARELARQLKLPLIILDLSTVISSFLGKTGSNLRRVLDYAQMRRSVLLLDEFDAIAKSRGDAAELGELKRLVTVLLQEIDNWPEGSLLLAATNHPELLDPAVWRRFEVTIKFELPSTSEISQFLINDPLLDGIDESVLPVLALVYSGRSFSTLATDLTRVRRAAALSDGDYTAAVLTLIRKHRDSADRAEIRQLALALKDTGRYSQRAIAELLGMSRDTIRRAGTGNLEVTS